MQPLVSEIQRKHKGNRQKVAEETMSLYREHGVKPAGGCLPLVLQMPILMRCTGVDPGVQRGRPTPRAGHLKQQFTTFLASNRPSTPLPTHRTTTRSSSPVRAPWPPDFTAFLPLNCQLIDPLKLHSPSTRTVWWLFNLDLAQVDHVFSSSRGFGFTIAALAVLAGLQFVQVQDDQPRAEPGRPHLSHDQHHDLHVPAPDDLVGRPLSERPDPVLGRVHRLPDRPAVPDHGLGKPVPALRLAAGLGAGPETGWPAGPRDDDGPQTTRGAGRPTRKQPTPAQRAPAATARSRAPAARQKKRGRTTMTFREFTGKNVEEAIRTAMKEFERGPLRAGHRDPVPGQPRHPGGGRRGGPHPGRAQVGGRGSGHDPRCRSHPRPMRPWTRPMARRRAASRSPDRPASRSDRRAGRRPGRAERNRSRGGRGRGEPAAAAGRGPTASPRRPGIAADPRHRASRGADRADRPPREPAPFIPAKPLGGAERRGAQRHRGRRRAC